MIVWFGNPRMTGIVLRIHMINLHPGQGFTQTNKILLGLQVFKENHEDDVDQLAFPVIAKERADRQAIRVYI